MLFYLRSNWEAAILGAAGSTAGLTRARVSAALWGPQRGPESKGKTLLLLLLLLPFHCPSFAVSEKFFS